MKTKGDEFLNKKRMNYATNFADNRLDFNAKKSIEVFLFFQSDDMQWQYNFFKTAFTSYFTGFFSLSSGNSKKVKNKFITTPKEVVI